MKRFGLLGLALSTLACVGSGDGRVTGQLSIEDCRGNEALNEPSWDMHADFFAAEPIEDVDRGSPENRLEIRIQQNGAHVEESDTLLISIPDVRKAAAEWLRRGGPSGEGAPLDVHPSGLVRASLNLFATCPLLSSRSNAIEALGADTPSQIFFRTFGTASKHTPDTLPEDFIIDFGDTIATRGGTSGFLLSLVDLRAKQLGERSHVSGTLRGSFDFEVRRGAAGQSFP